MKVMEGFKEDILYTKKEFEEQLRKYCSQKDISVRYILRDDLEKKYTYGCEGEDEVIQSKNVNLENEYDVKIEVWGSNSGNVLEECETLFNNYWNSEYVDKTTGFPTTEQRLMLEKCDKTLETYYEKNKKVALIMLDLDNFKDVNDKSNHVTGSKVLGEFAKLLFSVFFDCGILIHQTGDEFNIIFPYEDVVDIVMKVKKARDLVKTHNFSEVSEINLTMAVGIKCLENESMSFIEARTQAEKSYNPSDIRNSSKQRDSIRFACNGQRNGRGEKNIKLAWTRVISNLDCAISGNIYLEYIRRYVKEIKEIGSLQEKVDGIINWINPEFSKDTMRYTVEHTDMDTSEEISKVEICLSVAQGLLTNEHFLQNTISFGIKNVQINVYKDKNPIFVLNDELFLDEFEGQCDEFYRKRGNEKYKRAVLVQAGYDKCSIVQDLFYKVIRVDTRPTIGGGLPDFWAAALCELITIMKENPIFSDIIIWGKTKYTQNIINLLNSIKNWENSEQYNFRYISQKTFKSIEDIRIFQERFQGHIFVCNELDILYDRIYKIHVEKSIEDYVDKEKSAVRQRVLKRDLSYAEISLPIYDGCRVKTMAEAYPIVLEILRQKAPYNIKDQAGRELRELRDFKIVLSNPKSCDLPDYYVDDKQLLNDYYDKILGDTGSLFGKALTKDNQLDALIAHVIQAIYGKNKYATRRAVLVIPNEVCDENNYSPLGLISIWLAPRFIEDCVEIDFSYNWRTVEAVIGLPLSMYASVRFAEEITDMITKKIKNKNSFAGQRIRMGSVTYFAHSLHMFQETESMDIVRGIINDASI